VACVLGRVGLLLPFQAGHMPFVTMGYNCFCGAPWLFVLVLFFFFPSLNCQNLAWFGFARVQSYSVLFFSGIVMATAVLFSASLPCG